MIKQKCRPCEAVTDLVAVTIAAWMDDPGNCPNVSLSSVPGWNKMTPGNTTWPFSYYEQVLTFQVLALNDLKKSSIAGFRHLSCINLQC